MEQYSPVSDIQSNIIVDVSKALEETFKAIRFNGVGGPSEDSELCPAKVSFKHPDAEVGEEKYPYIFINLFSWLEHKTARMPNNRYTQVLRKGVPGTEVMVDGELKGFKQYYKTNYPTPWLLTYRVHTFADHLEDHWSLIHQIASRINDGRGTLNITRNRGTDKEFSELVEFHFISQANATLDTDCFYEAVWTFDVEIYIEDINVSISQAIKEINLEIRDTDNDKLYIQRTITDS
jgi:hypothetical protein